MIRFLLVVLLGIFFLGCEEQNTRPMVVSTNIWIGYSPLYYAEKKGWLREHNIKLVHTVSLGESLDTFKRGSADMFCGTQYEVGKVTDRDKNIGEIILFNRSNGGDMILSNFSIDELKPKKKIDVYLEINSINSVFFEYFTQKHSLSKAQLNFIDKTPDISSKIHMKKTPTVIITYSPYAEILKKQGYKEIASTKDSELLIIDMAYAPFKTTQEFSKEIDRLNFLIAKSLSDMKIKPKEYYEVINNYFRFKDYDEFKDAMDSIEWIYSSQNIDIRNKITQENVKQLKFIEPFKVGK